MIWIGPVSYTHLDVYKRQIVAFPVIDDGDDWQVEVFGEGVVAAVVSRNRHDGSGSVAGKNVFTDPNGNCLVGERVDGV